MTSTATSALFRKELQELYLNKGHARRGLVFSIVFAVLLGAGAAAFMAVVHDPAEPVSPWVLLGLSASIALSGIIFTSMLGSLVGAGEALAGERERHTLETLLAHPVSRSQLILAKSGAQLVPGWLTAVVASFTYTVVATALVGPWAVLAGLGLLVTSLLGATLAGALMLGAGLAASAGAETSKQAQQALIWMMLPLSAAPGLLAPLGSGNAIWIGIGLGAYALALGAGGWYLAARRCRRAFLLAR